MFILLHYTNFFDRNMKVFVSSILHPLLYIENDDIFFHLPQITCFTSDGRKDKSDGKKFWNLGGSKRREISERKVTNMILILHINHWDIKAASKKILSLYFPHFPARYVVSEAIEKRYYFFVESKVSLSFAFFFIYRRRLRVLTITINHIRNLNE